MSNFSFYFTHHAKPSAEEQVLIILDNHACHISLAIYEHCKKTYIDINPNFYPDEDFMAAEIFQSEPIVDQDRADSISESTPSRAVGYLEQKNATKV